MKKIINYLPDISILIGIWIFSYVTFFPIQKYEYFIDIDDIFDETGGIVIYNFSNHFKLFSIILVTLGLNIAIRRLINKFNWL